jgi:hypothetical protein
VGSVTGEPNAAESNTEKRMYTGSMGSECVSLLGCFSFVLGLGLATTPAFAFAFASSLALVVALTCVVPGACASKMCLQAIAVETWQRETSHFRIGTTMKNWIAQIGCPHAQSGNFGNSIV